MLHIMQLLPLLLALLAAGNSVAAAPGVAPQAVEPASSAGRGNAPDSRSSASDPGLLGASQSFKRGAGISYMDFLQEWRPLQVRGARC